MMINIRINEKNLEYDIYALAKAFYQNEEVNITNTSETGEDFSGFDVFYSEENVSCSRIDNNVVSIHEFEEVKGLDKPASKNAMKRCIYRVFNGIKGEELPWGTLTGIRPTKLPMGMLYEGKTDEEITAYLKETYLVSDEKIRLSIDIARREKTILDATDVNQYSLYVGIPFCPTTCLYCSFTSYPIARWMKRVDEYIDTLKKELNYVSDSFSDKKLTSVYIGGGTPTTLEADQLRKLIGYMQKAFDFTTVKEFTVEAGRPDSITEDKLRALKEMGVTRISINPQTMNQDTLDIIGRRHTVEDIKNAFNMARACGFDNINMDLILGLPGEGLEHVKNTMEEIKQLAPENITIHSLAIKRAAKMAEYLREHEEIKSENNPQMLKTTEDAAADMGLYPYYMYRQKNMAGNYENVGYAMPGKEGIYNILIMEEVQTIIACGAGTVTKRVYGDGRIERCDNVKDVALYISKIEEMIDRKRGLFKD